MKKKFLIAATLITLLFVSACSCAKTVSPPQKPEVKSMTHRLGQITSESIEIITTINVHNPNPISLPIKSVSADVSIDGIKLGQTEGKSITLEKNAETPVVVSTILETKKVPGFVSDYIKRKEKSTIVIDGKIVFDLIVMDYTYPFTYTKPFEMKPEIRSVSHKLGQVSADTIEIITSIVVFNPIPAPIPVKGVYANITVDGFGLGRLEGNATTIEKGTETPVTVVTRIDAKKVPDFIVEYIKRKEKSAIVIDGAISFDLGVTEYSHYFTYNQPFEMKPEIRSVTHRWGRVTTEASEVITTIVVYNPIPAPIPIKFLSADIVMDDIKVGRAENSGVTLEKNTETPVTITTRIDNTKMPYFWVEHLKRGEKSSVVINGNITFDMKVTDYSYSFTYQKPVETEILSRLQVTGPVVIEKKYKVPLIGTEVTAFKSMVKSVGVTWGNISNDTTELKIRAVIQNDNSYSIPSCKMVYNVSINQIPLASGETDSLTFPSGTDTEVNTIADLKTSQMDQWFVSHISRGEKSTLTVKMSAIFSLPETAAKLLGQDSITVPVWEKNVDINTDILSSVKY